MNELPLELENLILKYVRYVPLNKIEMKERLTDEYINLWDTLSVTDMSEMFFHVHNFNGDLSNWDTSNVETGLEHGK